jgi:hypothetical protein
MTELLALRAVVEAAPDAVADVLLDVRPGGRSPLAVTGEVEMADGDEFIVEQDGSRITMVLDRARRTVSEQGEWWYRGVTAVEPDPRGSLVVHRIYNVAPNHRWAVRLVSRGPLIAAPESFARHIAALGRTLAVAAWVVDD